MTERLHFHFSLLCIGEGNGNSLQCSCLENPRDGGAWWAALCGVAQSRTRRKQLSSSSSSPVRDQTHALGEEACNINHWATREVLTGFLYNFFFFRKYFCKNISVFQIASLPQLRDLLFSIHRAIYWGPYAGLQADILYVFSVNGWISHKVSPRGVVRRTVQRARSLTFRSSSLSWGESAINITGWSKPDCDNRP